MDWTELDKKSEEWKLEAERGADLHRKKRYWRVRAVRSAREVRGWQAKDRQGG